MCVVCLQRPRHLLLLGSILLFMLAQPNAWAEGQMRKVGIVTLLSADAASRSPLIKQLTDAIRASVPEQNVTFEFRSAEGRNDRYPQIINDLLQQRVDVIWTGAFPAAVAVKQLGVPVPVVFSIAVDPVVLGLVKSLERPGTTMTGMHEDPPAYLSDRMALFREMGVQLKTIGILWDAETWSEQIGREIARSAESAVGDAGARAVVVAVNGAGDLQRAFSSLKQAQVDGILVAQSPIFYFEAKKLAALAAEAKIPAIYPSANFAEAGGFAALGVDLVAALQLEGGYVGRILKGERPADLPILRPEKSLLTINAKAVRQLGIAIPRQIQKRANRLID